MAYFGKLYKFEKQENYEAFANTYDVTEEQKAFIINYTPDQKVEKDGDSYTYYFYSNGKERVVTFKSGVEFESTLRDTTFKNLYTVDGNTITQVVTFESHASTIIKVFSDDKLEETITNNISSVVAKRYYST